MGRLFSLRAVKAFTAFALAAVLLVSACETGRAAPAMAEWVAGFRLEADRYYNSVPFSTNRYKFTESEVRMLAIVIHLEARGEPYRCMLAVGNVVMNRVLAPGYPGKTLREVVTRPNQFCYNASVKPLAVCLRAARDVLEREIWVVPQNTYFFRMTGSRANWGSHTFYTRIGTTAFYREEYTGRYNGSAIPSALYRRAYRWPQYGCAPGLRVRKIQAMLKELGYDVAVDGYFGPGTKSALTAFQKKNGLAADGIAGPATLRALIVKFGMSDFQKL